MFKRTIAIALVFGLAAIAPPVSAGEQRAATCGERTSIVAALKKKHGESAAGVGIAGETAVVELWSSAETGTWTILLTRPDGVTCLMAAGHAWAGQSTELAALGDPA
ncbi:hypothetical protein G5B40_03990 [Pikeienuella piscinae]|uniref:Uncharacterized protein n=1 Tax=Pikeienuella piscinae TaxID=2748098 RepID=A0A7L5BUJ8_9RHOB|nr:hypothetical protein [Pikeienuella piscinae]QIE54673.1 hypothetical protein G5B40_03990 [Pikeienuella piscinae]